MTDDLYQYVVADYFATGEGRTVFILITRAYPITSDYEIQPSFTPDGYDPGKLSNTAEERAIREMYAFAGGYFGMCAQAMTREEFLKGYKAYVPNNIMRILTDDTQPQPGNLNFKLQVHLNFS